MIESVLFVESWLHFHVFLNPTKYLLINKLNNHEIDEVSCKINEQMHATMSIMETLLTRLMLWSRLHIVNGNVKSLVISIQEEQIAGRVMFRKHSSVYAAGKGNINRIYVITSKTLLPITT